MKPRLNDAVVNAGCLLFFARSTPVARRSDLLDSLLYLQLAATRKHERFSDFGRWNEVWLTAALRFGWTLNASEHLSERLPSSSSETVWTICTAALRPIVDAGVIEDAERQVRASVQDKALNLLSSQALRVSSNEHDPGQATVTLQLGFVDPQGTMSLAVVHFVTWQPLHSGFMFEPLEAGHLSGNLEFTLYSMRLSEQANASFRDPLSTALADKRPMLIRPLGDSVMSEGESL